MYEVEREKERKIQVVRMYALYIYTAILDGEKITL